MKLYPGKYFDQANGLLPRQRANVGFYRFNS
jgi:hypothetical protein